MLAGAPCTVVITGVDATAGQIVADAARDLLKQRGSGRPGFQTAVYDHTASARRTRWTLDGLVESLQDGTRLLCIYDGTGTVPRAMAQVSVPDGSRKIFDDEGTLQALRTLSGEMDDLVKEVAKEQAPRSAFQPEFNV